MKIYVSLIKSEDGRLNDILGAFIDKEKAMNRCLSERSFVKSGWKLSENEECSWNNGHGLRVFIKEYES